MKKFIIKKLIYENGDITYDVGIVYFYFFFLPEMENIKSFDYAKKVHTKLINEQVIKIKAVKL